VNVYRVLSEMLDEAVRWGVIASNPAAGIRPPRAPRPKLHIPDQQTCNAILERVRGRQVEGPVVMAIGTGERLGEILGATWPNIDLGRKVHRVASTLSYTGSGEFAFYGAEDLTCAAQRRPTRLRRHVPAPTPPGADRAEDGAARRVEPA
jgi:integrase